MGTTSSKKKKKAKLQRAIRSIKKHQRLSTDKSNNSNYYSPLTHLKDPQVCYLLVLLLSSVVWSILKSSHGMEGG